MPALARTLSVPAVRDTESPRLASGAVADGYVLQTPGHLGHWACAPIAAGRSHLRRRQRLRNSVGTCSGVGSPGLPFGLRLPQDVDAGELSRVKAGAGIRPRIGDRVGDWRGNRCWGRRGYWRCLTDEKVRRPRQRRCCSDGRRAAQGDRWANREAGARIRRGTSSRREIGRRRKWGAGCFRWSLKSRGAQGHGGSGNDYDGSYRRDPGRERSVSQ
jgi:hypothetical protein